MRRFLFSAVVAIALVFSIVPTAVADTDGPDGDGDLGLDGIAITSVAALKSGDVRVTGTIQCSEDLEWIQVYVDIRQDVGRFHSVVGFGGNEIACSADPGTASFSVIVEPETGRFGPNRAQTQGEAWTEECWWDEDIEEDVCIFDGVWIEPTMMKVRRGH